MSDLWEHIDLCSGIGGFSLGFQYAKLSEPILFCELDEFCQKILKKHWPDVPICNDVKELANDTNAFIPRPRERKRILTAGYPCQPFSQAGQRRGTEDPRHIWPYIFRIIQQERPNVCVFENVSGHISLGLDEVLHDLEGEGYTTRTFVLPAEACGASHRRDRLWIIARNLADTESVRHGRWDSEERGASQRKLQSEECEGGKMGSEAQRRSEPRREDVADTNGEPSKVRGQHQPNESKSLCWRNYQERSGTNDWRKFRTKKDAEDVADTNSKRGCSGQTGWQDAEDAGQSSRGKEQRGRNSQLQMGKLAHGIRSRLLGSLEPWPEEPTDIPRVATGQKDRSKKLKALGNAIVPQIAQRIGIAIRESF